MKYKTGDSHCARLEFTADLMVEGVLQMMLQMLAFHPLVTAASLTECQKQRTSICEVRSIGEVISKNSLEAQRLWSFDDHMPDITAVHLSIHVVQPKEL